MNCTDCQEPITTGEQRSARACFACKKPLHSECSMLGPGENDYCEACFYKDRQTFTLVMSARAMDEDARAKAKRNGASLLDEEIALSPTYGDTTPEGNDL